MNIKDYVLNEDTNSFDFDSEVDALVLAQSSYFQFENESISILPLKLSEMHTRKKTTSKNRLKRETHSLMDAMIASKKFGSICITDFESNNNSKKELQFAAVTYLINKEVLFIVFRGTDSTAVGWKEDFNMSFSDQVPSQMLGVRYLNRILSDNNYPVYTCGHSKGGNIAVYSAAFCEKEHRERIVKVYNFDGPGFRSDFLLKPEYNEILPKIVKYMPKASIVGKLLNTREKEIIVKSNQTSIFQHDIYNWVIENNRLVEVGDITKPAEHFSKSLQKWLEGITDVQRRYVINEIYSSFKQLNIDTFDDIWQFLSINTLKTIIKIFNDTDPKLKKYLTLITKQLVLSMIDFKGL